ncbi:MAG: arginase family protein [Bdellovibrionales bacterium]|nr:arginase family protein [Bdellovibrionales bacterium]
MARVKVIGVPYSIGCRAETAAVVDQQNGPTAIRQALRGLHSGYDIPFPGEDVGDIECNGSVSSLLDSVEAEVTKAVSVGDIPFILGGAHTLTLGSLRALSKASIDYSLIYFDAHPDVMPRKEIDYGSMIFHAFQEEVLEPARAAFIGVRQIETAEQKVLEENSIWTVGPLEFERFTPDQIVGQITDRMKPPYFLSFDLDVLDPSVAPGVSCPYPGGLTYREILYIVKALCKSEIVGLEVVELAPINDQNERTAKLAGHFIQEIATSIHRRSLRH